MTDHPHSYWSLPLADRLDRSEQVRLLAGVFVLVAASVLVLHLFLPDRQPVPRLLAHALQIALVYVVWFAILGIGFGALLTRRPASPLRVWHVWLLSAACYVLGFFAADFDDPLTFALHRDVQEGNQSRHFLRLVPVWILVTWVFTNAFVSRRRRADIERLAERLAEVNARLTDRLAAPKEPPGDHRIVFSHGRQQVDLAAADVSHVTVDDHHCYLHRCLHTDGGGSAGKIAIGVPLKELQGALPDSFVQVHRSHVVNTAAVDRVERQARRVFLHLRGGSRIPVSRQRLAEVLLRLRGP